ncbi:MAG: methyl-accepting chemotaxis protein, partial [Mycobacteriales bacterium]
MRRLQNLGVGQRLGAAFGLITLLLLAVVGVALNTNASQQRTERALLEQQRAGEAALQVKFRAADFNGWQTAYAFDAVRKAKGALDDTSGNRKEFLDSTAAFRTELAALDTYAELKGSRADTEIISRGFEQFMALDARIVALYRSGRPAEVDTATGLVLGDELTLFASIDKAAERIDTAVRQRSEAQERKAEREGARSRDAVLIVAALALLLAGLLAFFITRSLTAPLSRTVGLLRRVAGGDLTGRVEDPTGDELGQMGVALNESLERMSETVNGIAQGSETLSSASEELSAVSQQMSAAAEETASQAATVSAAAEQVSNNLQSVSAGAEELGSSIQEIARNTSEAATVAFRAVAVAEATN